MARGDNKSLLVLVRYPPYGNSLARVSLDVALAAAAFDQEVSLLFLGDGVLQLLPEQDSRALGMKNQGRTLASLPLYDIDRVYADVDAATQYNIDLQLSPVNALPLDKAGIRELLDSHDHLLTF